jgi:hypothetical protein
VAELGAGVAANDLPSILSRVVEIKAEYDIRTTVGHELSITHVLAERRASVARGPIAKDVRAPQEL